MCTLTRESIINPKTTLLSHKETTVNKPDFIFLREYTAGRINIYRSTVEKI